MDHPLKILAHPSWQREHKYFFIHTCKNTGATTFIMTLAATSPKAAAEDGEQGRKIKASKMELLNLYWWLENNPSDSVKTASAARTIILTEQTFHVR